VGWAYARAWKPLKILSLHKNTAEFSIKTKITVGVSMSKRLLWIALVCFCPSLLWASTPEQISSASEQTSGASSTEQRHRLGVSLGAGIENAVGNRSFLWQSYGATYDVKVQYSMDFPLTVQLGFSKTNNAFQTVSAGTVDISVNYFYLDTKYKIGPRWMPSLIVGLGQATKNETSSSTGTPAVDQAFMFSFGLSTEIPIAQQIYLVPEWRGRTISYNDRYSTEYNRHGVSDLTGWFSSWTLSLLSTF